MIIRMVKMTIQNGDQNDLLKIHCQDIYTHWFRIPVYLNKTKISFRNRILYSEIVMKDITNKNKHK